MMQISVIFVVLLLYATSLTDDNLDQPCEASFACSPSEDCQYYQQQIQNITTVEKTEVKNEILQHLRSLVCNKKSRKVCCPVSEGTSQASERKIDNSFQGCGNPLGQNQFALSGGGRTYSAPWAVSIGYYEDGEYQHECTGSVITENIVITAAHCTHDKQTKLVIQAGVLNLKSLGSTERKVIQTIEHPDYKHPKVYYDVSLAVLEKYLTFDEKIAPVCLPSQTYPNSDFMNRFAITIQGWGKDDNGDFGQDLTRIDLTVRRNSFCNKKYASISAARKEYWFPQLLTSPMFCANSNLGDNIGTCYGDSGGPSMIQDEDGVSYILMGVVSGNPGECGKTQEYPDYFTFIGHQDILPWIKSSIQKTRRFGDQQYPSVVYLSSSNSDYTYNGDILGIYKMDPIKENYNRPVWKHVKKRYWLYYDKENYWTMSSSINQNQPSASKSSTIKNDEKGLVYLPSTGWRYWDGSNWILDSSISISTGEPTYPEIVNIDVLNKSIDNNKLVGNYERISGQIFQNRPVWKNSYGKYLYFAGLLWKVGDKLEATDDYSMAVYGWDFSDEKIIWPNTDKLYIIDYPENITLSSDGAARDKLHGYMSIYRMIPNLTRNGRPVWRTNDVNKTTFVLSSVPEIVLSYNDNNYWIFLPEDVFNRTIRDTDISTGNDPNFKFKKNSVISASKGLFNFTDTKWHYLYDQGLKDDDETLRVTEGEPYYPDLITIARNKDPKNKRLSFRNLGLYKKISCCTNGRPVWRDYLENNYLYYSGKYWGIGSSVKDSFAKLSSIKKGLVHLPKDGWEYYDFEDSKAWVEDETIYITEGWSSYPTSIQIVNLSKLDKFKNFEGNYIILEERENDKPTWKHEVLDKYIFSKKEDPEIPYVMQYKTEVEHQWYIGDKVGEVENSVQIYGWDYSDDKYIWPNKSSMYITNYPESFYLQSNGSVSSFFPKATGTYELYPGLLSFRPRYKHTVHAIYLFYTSGQWRFVRFPLVDDLAVYSETNELIISDNEWSMFTDDVDYIHDETVTIIEGGPEYPETVLVSSDGKAGETFYFLMGIYKKVPKVEARGKPIWRHVIVGWFLFFDDFKQWRIGPNYNQTLGFIGSKVIGEYDFSRTDWNFLNVTTWVTDESLVVSGNYPRYPGTLSLIGLESKENSSYSGNYAKANKTFNNMPYFRNDDHYIFSDGREWFVGDRLGVKNSADYVYGWEYSDNMTIWPNNRTLYIIEYPQELNVSSEGGALKLFSNMMGIYNVVSDLLFSGRPVWQHSKSLVYLFYWQGWAISQSLGDLFTVYMGTGRSEWEDLLNIPEKGWQYLNASATPPNINDTTLTVKAVNIL